MASFSLISTDLQFGNEKVIVCIKRQILHTIQSQLLLLKKSIWVSSVLGIYNFEAALNQSVTLALLKCHLWALVSLSFQSYDVTYTFKSRVGCDSKDTSPMSSVKFFSSN